MDAFVDTFVVPGTNNGLFDRLEMFDLVSAVRSGETEGHYAARAYERIWERIG